MSDVLVRALLNDEVSVLACDISKMAEEARVIHELSPVATIILGRALAAGTMMSTMLKNKGDRLTLMINGNGEAGTIMVVGDAALHMKGYVANPQVNPPASPTGGFDIAAAVGNEGFITVIRDTGIGQPYIGKVKLVSGEIGEDVANYFMISEQQPSIVYVNTWLETDMSVLNAGGLIIRPLPNCSDETLKLVETKIGKISNYALMLFQSDVETVLKDIFDAAETKSDSNIDDGPVWDLKILDRQHPVYMCDCSRDRIKEVVVSLGEKEIIDMMEKEHGAQVKCHFCGKEYDFNEAELDELLKESRNS